MKLSVCIATFNGAPFIVRQLRSILKQLKIEDEIILVDDKSTDDTLNLVKAINDSRIKIFENSLNFGVVPTFNKSLSLASGDLIFLSDQDDEWESFKVKEITKIFKKSNVDLLVHDATVIFEGQGSAGSLFRMIKTSPGVIKNLISNSFTGCCMVFRKEVLDGVLPVPNRVGVYHDAWIGIFAHLNGFQVNFLKKKLIKFNRHESNLTTLKRRNLFYIILDRISLIISILSRLTLLKIKK